MVVDQEVFPKGVVEMLDALCESVSGASARDRNLVGSMILPALQV